MTVFHDDDEAANIWEKKIGIPKTKIQRRGMADNFWSMGVPGPCGPCSEIYFDRGPDYGKDGGPIADEDRYLEIWNLVFMQNLRGEGGGKDNFPILGELPAKNIDTGMGLERTAALLQGVDNIYEIDTTAHILGKASSLSGVAYGKSKEKDVSLRVVADHARTATMLIGDGVTPGNEGRGYVLRRMMRRTIRNMRLLGAPDKNMSELITHQIDMGRQPAILPGLQADIDAYQATIKQHGINFLHMEALLISDTHEYAGTTDRIITIGNQQPMILDLKTGSIDYAIQSIAVQLALYANAEHLYDWRTDERTPMPNVSKTQAMICHLPAGTGQCTQPFHTFSHCSLKCLYQ